MSINKLAMDFNNNKIKPTNSQATSIHTSIITARTNMPAFWFSAKNNKQTAQRFQY